MRNVLSPINGRQCVNLDDSRTAQVFGYSTRIVAIEMQRYMKLLVLSHCIFDVILRWDFLSSMKLSLTAPKGRRV